MRDKIATFLREHVKTGANLAAAVSGGMDSMAMLDALIPLSSSCGFSLTVVHFNHLLRGEESFRDEDFVRNFCTQHGIPFKIGRGDVNAFASENSIGLEEAARSMRYAYFSSLSEMDYVLTAHTADDNLETVLMRLIRGAGLHGLSGIPAVRGNILRPMLEISRADISRYCVAHSIPFVEDSSNHSDDFLRNRIRHYVVPLLKKENPSIVADTALMCRLLSEEDKYMQNQAEHLVMEICQDGRLNCPELLKLPEAMELRILGLFLSEVPGIGRVHLTSAMELTGKRSPSASLNLPGGYRLCRSYDMLELVKAEDALPSPEPVSILPGQMVSFGHWMITCSEPVKQFQLLPGMVALDASVLESPLTIRAPIPGDRIRLSGGTKKISRFLIDKKIPASLRRYLPILCAGEKIAAVLPIEAAAEYRFRKGNNSILLYVMKMEGET